MSLFLARNSPPDPEDVDVVSYLRTFAENRSLPDFGTKVTAARATQSLLPKVRLGGQEPLSKLVFCRAQTPQRRQLPILLGHVTRKQAPRLMAGSDSISIRPLTLSIVRFTSESPIPCPLVPEDDLSVRNGRKIAA